MFRWSKCLIVVGCSLGLASLAGGCGRSEDSRTVAQRSKLQLATEPPAATSIAAAKEYLPRQPEVVIVGRIVAGDFEPFEQGKAAFILSDLPADGTDHSKSPGHDAENCPFCKHKAAQAPKAIVQFVDEHGQVIPIDARELFQLKKNQVVVVQGRGEVNQLGMVVLTARSIYARR